MPTFIPLAGNIQGINEIVVGAVFITLDMIAVGLRLWCRRLKNKKLQINDYTIIAALMVMTARYIVEVFMVIYGGWGRPQPEVIAIAGPEAPILFVQLLFVDDILWLTVINLVKISILNLYTSIFRRNKTFVLLCRMALGLVGAALIAFIVVKFALCHPLAYNWDKTISGYCGNATDYYLSVVTTDLFLDLVIIILPMPVIWHLQLNTTKRIDIMLAFGLGGVICLLCAVRIKYILGLETTNLTYTLPLFGVFAAMEPLLGIINACLPTLPPVLKKIRNSSVFSSDHPTKSFSSFMKPSSWRSTQDKRSHHGGDDHFERIIDDLEHPLVDIPPRTHMADASASHGTPVSPINNPHDIKVTTGWAIDSSSGTAHAV